MESWYQRKARSERRILAIVCMSILVAGVAVPADLPPATSAAQDDSQPLGPQLELTITGPQKTLVGGEVTFELVVTNVGKTRAMGLVLVDHFQPGLEHAVAPSPIEHDLKDLAPGESQRLGVAFRVKQPGKLSHRVEVVSRGKVVAAAESLIMAVGSAPASASQKPPEAAEASRNKLSPTATRAPDKSAPARPTEPTFEFPDIPPREPAPSTDATPVPNLGPPLVDSPQDLKRLHDKFPIWVDQKRRRVVLMGLVCAREVPLELFACLMHSKEHESVVAVPIKASFVHAALLAVGAEPGSPVQFQPKYVPARGTEIEITCVWNDQHGKRQTARAQDWVRNAKTGKALEYPWVFAGSRFRKDPDTGATYYQADADGDLICVSNFPGAVLDLPIESTSSDAELLFEAFTEHIPPRGTQVTLILTPQPKKTAPSEPRWKQVAPSPGSTLPPKKPAPSVQPPAKPAGNKPAGSQGTNEG